MQPIRIVQEQRGGPDEPPEIRNLTKKALHERMSQEYFLPPNSARGVTRAYLVGVYTRRYYRVGLFDMQRFMAELTPTHMKKAPYINSNDIKAKVQVLLREHELLPLGYPDGVIPEEGWLLQIARMLDQTNTTSIFTTAIPNPERHDTLTSRMHVAKVNAETFLLRQPGYLADPRMFAHIESIWNSHKRLANKRREVLALEATMREMLQRQEEEATRLTAHLNEAANLLYQMRFMTNTQVMFDEGHLGQAARNRVRDYYGLYAETNLG
jgi:hypothetical protein